MYSLIHIAPVSMKRTNRHVKSYNWSCIVDAINFEVRATIVDFSLEIYAVQHTQFMVYKHTVIMLSHLTFFQELPVSKVLS